MTKTSSLSKPRVHYEDLKCTQRLNNPGGKDIRCNAGLTMIYAKSRVVRGHIIGFCEKGHFAPVTFT